MDDISSKPISDVIAEIKKTKGRRKYCNSLHRSLNDDGYVSGIVNWVRVARPEAIDALIEHIEHLEQRLESTDAALSAWEKMAARLLKGSDGVKSAEAAILDLLNHENMTKVSGEYIIYLERQLEEEQARVVKLPRKSIGWGGDGRDDFWNNAIDACRSALIAAGIKVEGE